jgi:hypothetical protein
MALKTGRIIRRRPSARPVRICVGRDPETWKPKYIVKSIHGGLRDARPPEPLQKPARIAS